MPFELTGLALPQLLAVFSLAGASLVGLYILKLRRRRVLVAFAPLWARVLVEHTATSLFSRLKRLLSLLVQLVILALLVGALGDPRVRGARTPGRSMVVLLDGSASMKATDVPGGRARAARTAVRRLVDSMGPGDKILLAQMDAEITALTPMTDDVSALVSALEDYRPRDTGADFARALRFGMDALQNTPRSEILVVGDGAYPEARDSEGTVSLGAVTLRYLPIGRRGRNVGIAAFAARRYPIDPSRFEVMAEVQSFSDRPESIELTLTAAGAPLEVTRFTLAPGEKKLEVLPDLSAADETLEAAIARTDGTHDDLGADDHAYATLPPRRRARVLAVTPGNRYLEAALLLDEYLDVDEASPAEAPEKLSSGHWDVVIFDGAALRVPEGTGVVYLRPEGPNAPMPYDPGWVSAPAHGAITPDHVDTHHPLLRWADDLEEAHIGRILRYHPLPGDRVLASSAQGPLLIAGERHGGRILLFAFDVRESDLPLLVAWPVTILSAIDWFAGGDEAWRSSFRTGETWRVALPVGVTRAVVSPPGGSVFIAPMLEGRAVFLGTHEGFYRVHAGATDVLIAGNLFDPMESQCAPRATLTVGDHRASPPRPGHPGVRRELWIYLLMLALGILVIEWATWHRRVTV